MKYSKIDYYRETLGFSMTYKSGKNYKIKCDSCEALVINGVPCHESGCRRATHECNGCNEQIPQRQKYCQNCA